MSLQVSSFLPVMYCYIPVSRTQADSTPLCNAKQAIPAPEPSHQVTFPLLSSQWLTARYHATLNQPYTAADKTLRLRPLKKY